jgi:nitrite reductase/ring-hydroxylating ferredoxin subunit
MDPTGGVSRPADSPPGSGGGRADGKRRAPARRCRLGLLSEHPDGAARGYVADLGRARRRVIALRRGGAVLGFADACPHMGVPLAWPKDAYLTPDGRFLRCANHGALFDLDGQCVFGPCKGERLPSETIEVVDGLIWLVI